MDSGAGGFPHGIEPRQGGAAVQIRHHAPHPIVGSRGHGDGLGEGIHPPALTDPHDVGKAVVDAIVGNGLQVQPHPAVGISLGL
jgi:hypothetical protein